MRVAMIDPGGFSLPYDTALCRALASEGHQVRLVTCPDVHMDIQWPPKVERAFHFYRVSQAIRKRWSAKGRWVRYIKGAEHVVGMSNLSRALSRWGPDVVHFQWLVLPMMDRLFLPTIKRVAPIVLTVHDTDPFNGHPSSDLQIRRFENAIGLFDGVIVHTEFSRRQLLRMVGVSRDQVAIVDHGILDYYADDPDSHSLEPQTSQSSLVSGDGRRSDRVLLFGSLKPYKGLDVLVEALAQVPAETRAHTVVEVVGSPAMDVEPIKRRAQALGIAQHIEWDLRRVPEHEVPSVFRRASIVVLPYRRIDQSGVLMTALAFGKPVIASRVGGFPEVLQNGVHGCLVAPNDSSALSEALVRLLEEPDLRARMEAAVRHIATTRFSWRHIAQGTGEIYQSLRVKH